MAKAQDWIVFIDINGEWNAEVNPHDDNDQVQDIYDKGGRIQAFILSTTKTEAINYAMEVCTR